MFLPHPRVKVSIVGSLRDREVACSAPDRQGSNFESCVWRTVSSQSSHHPQEVLLAQFSLSVHKGGLKPDSFHLFPSFNNEMCIMISPYGLTYQRLSGEGYRLREYSFKAPSVWQWHVYYHECIMTAGYCVMIYMINIMISHHKKYHYQAKISDALLVI